MPPLLRSIGYCVTLCGIIALGEVEPVAAQAPGRAWHATGTLRADEQANNNVFLLSDDARVRLDTFTTPASPATRFADMRNVHDYITAVRLGLGVEGPGLFGRTLTIRSDSRYDWYALNAKRRNADLASSSHRRSPIMGACRSPAGSSRATSIATSWRMRSIATATASFSRASASMPPVPIATAGC